MVQRFVRKIEAQPKTFSIIDQELDVQVPWLASLSREVRS